MHMLQLSEEQYLIPLAIIPNNFITWTIFILYILAGNYKAIILN